MDTTSKHSAVAPSHFLNLSRTNQQILFVLLLLVCLTFSVSPPIALLLGLIIANLSGHPFLHLNHKATSILLQISVVGLGFGMNLHSAIAAGKEGMLLLLFLFFLLCSLGLSLENGLELTKK